MKIILGAHSYLAGPYVVGSHHLARQFAKMGHKVLHLSTPVTYLHNRKNDKRIQQRWDISSTGVVEVESNLFEYIPRLLLPSGRLVTAHCHDLAMLLAFPSVKKYLRKSAFHDCDLLLLDQPKLAGLIGLVRAKKMIYRPTDLYAEMNDSLITKRLEGVVLSNVDAVIATSVPVSTYLRERCSRNIPFHVLENGVDLSHFTKKQNEPEDLTRIPRPRAVYVGALDYRFDWKLLCLAAKRLPLWHFVLVGPCKEVPANVRLPGNVHLMGERSYNSVPAYLQNSDLALLPMSPHKANEGRSPMKLYEYLASGLVVLAKNTQELSRRALSDVYLYNTEEEFVTRILENSNKSVVVNVAEKLDWKHIAGTVLELVFSGSTAQPAQQLLQKMKPI